MDTTDFAGYRQEVRLSLTGRTLKAADNLADVYSRWEALLSKAERRRPDLEARAAAYRAECQRIATLMRDRGWDIYDRTLDQGAR